MIKVNGTYFIKLKTATKMIATNEQDEFAYENVLIDECHLFIEQKGLVSYVIAEYDSKEHRPQINSQSFFMTGLVRVEMGDYYDGDDICGYYPSVLRSCCFSFSKFDFPEGSVINRTSDLGLNLGNAESRNLAYISLTQLYSFINNSGLPFFESEALANCFFESYFSSSEFEDDVWNEVVFEFEPISQLERSYIGIKALSQIFGEEYKSILQDKFRSWCKMIALKTEEKIEAQKKEKAAQEEKLKSESSNTENEQSTRGRYLQDDNLPNALYLAYGLYDEIWNGLPETMSQPTKQQLHEHLEQKGVASKSEREAIIKVSTPDDIIFGGHADKTKIAWDLSKY